MKLPSEISAAFTKRKGNDSPIISIRALTDINGNLGETYLLTDENSIMLCSGKIGESYTYHDYRFSDFQTPTLKKDPPFAYLTFAIDKKKIKLKFPAYDMELLDEVARKCGNQGETRPSSAPNPRAESAGTDFELTPLIGLSALLHAVVSVNGDDSPCQLKNLELIIGNSALLQQGVVCWQNNGEDRLLQDLIPQLTHEQRLCVMANLLDTAMVDGILESREKQFLEEIRVSFEIDADEFNNIFDTLVIKNNLRILEN